MSTYHSIWWLPLCGGLTGLGLVLSYFTARRRGLRSGVRGAAWSLLPLAAYLTGSIEMFWKIGVAIGDFAKGFAFSTKVWSGIAVAGLAVVLFLGSGGLRRRRVRQGKDAGAVSGSSAGPGSVGTGAAGTGAAGTVAVTSGRAGSTGATGAPADAATAPAKLPRRAKTAAAADSGDDDMKDVEEILRRRGIS